MKNKLISKILKCTEMHYKSWFEAFFCEVFLTIAVKQLQFLKFSQCLRCKLGCYAEHQNQLYCNSGTILLYSRNLSKFCHYIRKSSKTSPYMKKINCELVLCSTISNPTALGSYYLSEFVLSRDSLYFYHRLNLPKFVYLPLRI